MKLDVFLDAVRNCPDIPPDAGYVPDDLPSDLEEMHMVIQKANKSRRLKWEFGLFDNYPILLRANFDEVVADVRDSPNSDHFFDGTYLPKEDSSKSVFLYEPGAVIIQILPGLTTTSHDEPLFLHRDKQRKEFNMSFLLHPYQKERVPEVHNDRVMAIVLEDICNYAKKKGHSLCLPKTGFGYSNDHNRIVYFGTDQVQI